MRTGWVAAFVLSICVCPSFVSAQTTSPQIIIVNGQSSVMTPPSPPPAQTVPPPVEAPPERGSRVGQTLAITGGAVLGGGWVFGIIIGLFGGYHDRVCWIGPCSAGPSSWDPAWDNFRATSLIPIIGPWVQLAVKPSSEDGWPTWLVIDGIIQGVGTILMFVGIGIMTSDDDATPPPVTVLPMLSPTTAGLMVLGNL